MLAGLQTLQRFFSPIIASGAHGLSISDERRIKVINSIAVLASLLTSVYTLIYIVHGWWILTAVGSATLLFYMIIPLLNHLGWTRFSPFYVLTAAFIQLTIIPGVFTGPETGIHYILFFSGPFAWLTLKAEDRWCTFPIVVISFAGFIWVDWFTTTVWRQPIPESILNLLYLHSTTSAAIVITSIVVLFSRELERTQRALDAEHERARALLLNILPASIAQRLQHDHSTIADHYDNASVMFADIVGFTELSTSMDANALVDRLNRYFSAFDSLVKKHRAEKIKTIGDAYMVAAGVPEPSDNHALVLTELAIEMLAATEKINAEYDQPMALRIGINTGPLVAGVMGKHKFVYDLWGDTVNVAQRMEAHGVVGKVHVSDSTFNQICRHYDVAPRGDITIKGKGRERTWLVIVHRGRSTRQFGPDTPMRPGLAHEH